MARDDELDRLKDQQDRAFQDKQGKYQALDQAWNKRSAAHETMDRAYHEKQAAYDVQNATWQDLQHERDRKGPRIENLNAQQEAAYQNMKSAFDSASHAYESRDGESASQYAQQGHQYKAEAQEAVAERRQLVQDLRDARDRHEDTKPAFQRSKGKFDEARNNFIGAKADHEQKQAEFKRAKAEFDRVKDAFQARLASVRSESKRRKDDKRLLAQQAGVPNEYLDDVWISTSSDGTVNFYFGGIGEPAGPGHGHYAMDSSGNVTYRREPFDPHGSENFTDSQRGVLYDRSVSSKSPMGAQGGYSFRNAKGHATQYYEDGSRVSWNLDENSDQQNKHWTDQNARKGRSGRHDPPPHAK